MEAEGCGGAVIFSALMISAPSRVVCRLPRPFAAVVIFFTCVVALSLGGCKRFKPAVLKHYVYVTSKGTFLRDRVAAVSNRTGNVVNGQRLEILDQQRRFYKVRTDDGIEGWIDERQIATEKISDEFAALGKEHANDPVVSTGVVRDDVFLHSAPGRDTDRFYRFDEGAKLKLLARASTLKPVPPGTAPAAATAKKDKKGNNLPAEPPPPPAMEDWWLVRDANGRTGWMLNRMMETDAPEAVGRYAENQRVVGTYVLNTVQDPEMEGASQEVPQYVMALGPFQTGLPYDFNQLRVFTWNLKKHRYETANRDKNILGYFPVKIGTETGTGAPTYTYTVLAGRQPVPTPDESGRYKPGALVTKVYRLEGNVTRRILPPGTQPPAEARLEPEEKKDKKKKK